MKWWQLDPSLLADIRNCINEHYPDLKLKELDDGVEILGKWSVYGKEHLIRDYEIKIMFPDDYPKKPPKVMEVGGAIPPTKDHHVNLDGSACLFASPERWEKWPLGAPFANFMLGPVTEFFFSQAYHQLTNSWPFGEWSHGDTGIVEFFANRLKIYDLKSLKQCVLDMLKPQIFRQERCPCGSRERTIRCHGTVIKELKSKLPSDEIVAALSAVDNLLKNGIHDVTRK